MSSEDLKTFYRNWLQTNQKSNSTEEIRNENRSEKSENREIQIDQQSHGESLTTPNSSNAIEEDSNIPRDPNEIVFENEDIKLFIERGTKLF
jgi:hypothetical protein